MVFRNRLSPWALSKGPSSGRAVLPSGVLNISTANISDVFSHAEIKCFGSNEDHFPEIPPFANYDSENLSHTGA